MYDTQAPFIASFVVFRKGSEVALVLRENTKWMNGYWGFPSGKVEKNESFSECAVREAKEEVGLSVKKEDLVYINTTHRHSVEADGAVMDWVDVYFEATKWEGKLTNGEPHKHSDVAWFDIDKLPDNTIPPHRESLEAAIRGERYYEYGWE